MSATNQTSNYDLPLFIGTDKPSWLGDFNGAMNAIDTAIKGRADDISSLTTRMTATETVANTASSNASTALTNASNAGTAASAAQTTADTANTAANAAQSTANTALSNASTAQTTADTANSTAQSALALGNSNAADIAKFNLSVFETPTNAATDKGSIQVGTNTLQVAKNSDGSLAKIYGGIAVQGVVTAEYTPVTVSFTTTLRPTQAITIANCGMYRVTNNQGGQSLGPISMTIDTSGNVTLTSVNYFADTTQLYFILFPCLYWVKDFGDVPINPET